MHGRERDGEVYACAKLTAPAPGGAWFGAAAGSIYAVINNGRCRVTFVQNFKRRRNRAALAGDAAKEAAALVAERQRRAFIAGIGKAMRRRWRISSKWKIYGRRRRGSSESLARADWQAAR